MTRILTLGIALALTGCATEEDAATPAVSADGASLRIVQNADLSQGVYDDGERVIRFRSELVTETDLDIELEFNDMMVTMTVDYRTGAIEYDGFALDGSETQLLDEDRAVILTLNRALETLDAEAVREPTVQLRRFTSTWAEFPATLELAGHTKLPMERSYTSICAQYGTYQGATHDGWRHDRWDDDATLDYAYVSMHASCPSADGTNFWSNSQWDCFEPDHSTSIEYAYGGCLGRCGSECGSDSQFTWDCLDHDQCVRTGHSVASMWCNDEFLSTTDDWASAPNCL